MIATERVRGLVLTIAALAILAPTDATAQRLLEALPSQARAQAHASVQRIASAKNAQRFREVRVRREVLDGARAPSGRFVLDLFDAEAIDVEVESVVPRSTGAVSWFGRVRGQSSARVNLVESDAGILGSIELADGRIFDLKPMAGGGGRHALREMTASTDGECEVTDADAVNAPSSLQEGEGGAAAPSSSAAAAASPSGVVDVLVVYTPLAAGEAAGQFLLMPLLAQLAVDETNAAYALSGITGVSLNLVATRQILYDETVFGDGYVDHRDRLASTTDDIMDEIHGWRDALAADMVTLLVSRNADNDGSPGTGFGIAYINSNAAQGFNVSSWEEARAPGYTFMHEYGHNFGGRHDMYSNPNTSPATVPETPCGTPSNIGVPGTGCEHASFSWGYALGGYKSVMVRRSIVGIRRGIHSTPTEFLVTNPVPIPAGTVSNWNARTLDERGGPVSAFRADPSEVYLDFGCPTPDTPWGSIDSPICDFATAVLTVASGGTVFFPSNTVLSSPQTVNTAVTLDGANF